MTNVVQIDKQYLMGKLNSLPPCSRLRPGICAIMQEINRRELEAHRVEQICVSGLERAFADDAEFMQHLREVL